MLNGLIATILLMLGNIFTGVAKSKSLQEFDKQVLIDSLYKYGGVLLACGCIYAASFFIPEIEISEGFTLSESLYMIENSCCLIYGFKLVQNVMDILQIKKQAESLDISLDADGVK